MKVQQPWIHRIAWATAQGHHKNKNSHEDRNHNNKKGKKTVAEEQPSEPPKAKTHKSVDSDEDDDEPQNEPGTFSNTQPTVPVFPYNSGDEDSEYIAMKKVHKVKTPKRPCTIQISTF